MRITENDPRKLLYDSDSLKKQKPIQKSHIYHLFDVGIHFLIRQIVLSSEKSKYLIKESINFFLINSFYLRNLE